MPFPHKDPAKAKEFMVEYLAATQTDPVLLEAWKKLGMVVGFQFDDLGIGFGLDTSNGREIVILSDYPDPAPQAAMKTTSDTFHDIFTGRLNVGMAFMRRSVRTEGNIAGILKLASLMPRNIKIYKELLAQKGATA